MHYLTAPPAEYSSTFPRSLGHAALLVATVYRHKQLIQMRVVRSRLKGLGRLISLRTMTIYRYILKFSIITFFFIVIIFSQVGITNDI